MSVIWRIKYYYYYYYYWSAINYNKLCKDDHAVEVTDSSTSAHTDVQVKHVALRTHTDNLQALITELVNRNWRPVSVVINGVESYSLTTAGTVVKVVM